MITTAGGVLVAMVTGLLAWIGSRGKTKTDIQSTINDGFSKLITDLQEEVQRCGKNEIILRDTISKQDVVIYNLHKRVYKLARIVTLLHGFIADKGLQPPNYEEDTEEQKQLTASTDGKVM